MSPLPLLVGVADQDVSLGLSMSSQKENDANSNAPRAVSNVMNPSVFVPFFLDQENTQQSERGVHSSSVALSTPPPVKKIRSVLFACAMNAVRSPMAETLARHYFGKSMYVQSAGVRKGELDGFAVSALDEIGLNMSKHSPRTIEELEDWEGLNFDLIITLSPEAHHKALQVTSTIAADVEYWPTQDPTLTQGSRDQCLEAYRDLRNALEKRIKARLTL
jgi:protein-tyrosine-phosphatase